MKMYGVDRSIVNLRLRRAQRLENRDRRLLRLLADRSLANRLANVFQPTAMFMNVLVRVSMHVRRVRMLVAMTALPLRRSMLMVFIMMRLLAMVLHRFGLRPRNLASPKFVPRHILLAANVDVHLGGRNPAAHHSRYFEVRR